MEDSKIVEKNLRTLSEKYNYIVCSIEESKDINNISVDELQSSLFLHAQKLKMKDVEEQALKVTGEEGPVRKKKRDLVAESEEVVVSEEEEGVKEEH